MKSTGRRHKVGGGGVIDGIWQEKRQPCKQASSSQGSTALGYPLQRVGAHRRELVWPRHHCCPHRHPQATTKTYFLTTHISEASSHEAHTRNEEELCSPKAKPLPGPKLAAVEQAWGCPTRSRGQQKREAGADDSSLKHPDHRPWAKPRVAL